MKYSSLFHAEISYFEWEKIFSLVISYFEGEKIIFSYNLRNDEIFRSKHVFAFDIPKLFIDEEYNIVICFFYIQV